LLSFDRVFSELFVRNFNAQSSRYRSWFETFLCLLIGDGGGVALKGKLPTYTLQLLLGAPLTVCTLQLLLVATLKAR